MTINPLVVPTIDQPTDIWAGIWIAEDIELIVQGVRNNSWVDTSLGSISAGLDGLALISDPGGAMLQYIASWVMEHFKPLTEVLDWLAGDPGQIAGHAATWRNVSHAVRQQVADLTATVNTDVRAWGGIAGPAYRSWAQLQHTAIDGLANACEAMATITECAGHIVAAVRILIRDLIAIAFSRTVSYGLELGLSIGFAAPIVLEQVTTLILSTGARIARLLRSLVDSLRRLFDTVPRLHQHINSLEDILNRLRRNPAPGRTELAPPTTGYRSPDPGTPEWSARRDELSRDPATGGKAEPKKLWEAEVALACEARGILPGPIRRGGMDNTNPAFQRDLGDLVDATGQVWEIKAPTDIFPPGAPQAGQPMPPGLRGRYRTSDFERSITKPLGRGQNVILDTANLTPASLADLKALVARHPEWAGKVVFYP